ncbi:hypothetical protein VNO80_20895 [Phaseolus coccineus]|uniref:Serine protease EDA2 n=1 Tax=Phaseolus coccineus TaxID=3886 RepID=A0AAN9M233_PHACN
MRMREHDGVISTALTLLLFVSFPAFSYGLLPPRTLLSKLSKGSFLTTQELWFHQTLDHFSPHDHREFGQRYYEFVEYFEISDGPIFLVIGGESELTGIENDYVGVLAKKFGAAIVSLEHRYYGKSSPFDSLETQNLKYLSSKQALFDLAVFRQYYQNSLNAKLSGTKIENPWFVFGGSYAGALSAWFRLKFPHLTCGSLASSAVVLSVYNYTEYDQQVGTSAGAECKSVLQETTQLIEHKLATNGEELKASFNADDLERDGDFMYLVADAAALAIQNGTPDKLCNPMVKTKKAGEDLVDAYAKYVKEFFFGTFGFNVQIYDQEYLKKTSINEDSSTRLWWFQVCTEVANFQVAPSNDSIRSSKLDTKYHLDLCKNVFGEGVFPDVDETNLYYGGTNIAGSKIIFSNGSQDPWRHASKQTSSTDLPSYTITCSNCAHCTDLRGCPLFPLTLEGNENSCSSPHAVRKVRLKISKHMELWLSECDTGKSYM